MQRAPFEAFEISQHQLSLDRLGITNRIDGIFDMGDVAIRKATQDMGDRVDLANMGEKLVTEPFTAGGTTDQPGDVDEFELGRNDLRRFCEAGTNREPLVRYRDAPN